MSEDYEKALDEIDARIGAVLALYESVSDACGGDLEAGRRYAAAQWQETDDSLWAEVAELFEIAMEPSEGGEDPFSDDEDHIPY